MLGRRVKRTYSQIMMDELNQGFDHLWLAGAAAAAGLGATMGPRWAETKVTLGPPASRVRDAANQSWESTVSAIAPLVGVARREAQRATVQIRREQAAKKGRSMSRKGWMVAAGLVTLGAGAGIAGALMMRRRRRAQWEEFDARAAVDMVQGDSVLMEPAEGSATGRTAGDKPAGTGKAAGDTTAATGSGNASTRHGDDRASTPDGSKPAQAARNTRQG